MKITGLLRDEPRALEVQFKKALSVIGFDQLPGRRPDAVRWASDQAGLEAAVMIFKKEP